MNIEGRIISMRKRDEEQIYMTMEMDEEEWLEIRRYAFSCCEDYDEQIDFHFEFLSRQQIEFNVTNFITDIHDNYFKKGDKMSKFPFKATFYAFYCPMTIYFHMLAIV